MARAVGVPEDHGGDVRRLLAKLVHRLLVTAKGVAQAVHVLGHAGPAAQRR